MNPSALPEPLGMVCAFIFAAVFLIVYVGSVGWAARDAESRGKSGCLVAVLVAFLSWPVSLLMWLAFRPETHAGTKRNGE